MAYYPYYGFFSFQEIVLQWEQVGVFDIILPLLLIFTVVYAILDRTKIFGEDKRSINAIIAIAISFFSISNLYITAFFKILFTQVALGIAILVAIILLTALLVGSKDQHGWRLIITIMGFLVFIWMFSRAADEYQRYYGIYAFGMFTPDWWAANAAWISLLVVIGIVVAVVVSSGSKKPKSIPEIAKEWIGGD